MNFRNLSTRIRTLVQSPQFVNGATRGGNFFLSLFLVPLQAREYGAQDYAAIVLATSAFTIVGLLDFGFAFSLQQDAATSESGAQLRIRGLMVDIVFIQTAFALFGLACAAFYVTCLPHSGVGFASHRGQDTFAWVLGWQLFSLPGASYWRWLLGSGRAARASVVANSQTFCVLLLTIITQLSGLTGALRDFFLCAGYGAPGLIALLDVAKSAHKLPPAGIFLRLKEYFWRSIGWAPLALLNSVCSQVPIFVISTKYSAVALAWYSIGSRLFNYPLSVAQIVFFDYWPRLRLALNNQNSSEVHRSVRRSCLWLLAGSGCFLAFAVTGSTTIFKLWHVPAEMIPNRATLFGLGLTFIVSTTSIPIASALSALEARFWQSVLLLVSSILILTVGWFASQVSLFLLCCGAIGLLTIPAWWAAFSRQLPKFQQSFQVSGSSQP